MNRFRQVAVNWAVNLTSGLALLHRICGMMEVFLLIACWARCWSDRC